MFEFCLIIGFVTIECAQVNRVFVSVGIYNIIEIVSVVDFRIFLC